MLTLHQDCGKYFYISKDTFSKYHPLTLTCCAPSMFLTLNTFEILRSKRNETLISKLRNELLSHPQCSRRFLNVNTIYCDFLSICAGKLSFWTTGRPCDRLLVILIIFRCIVQGKENISQIVVRKKSIWVASAPTSQAYFFASSAQKICCGAAAASTSHTLL